MINLIKTNIVFVLVGITLFFSSCLEESYNGLPKEIVIPKTGGVFVFESEEPLDGRLTDRQEMLGSERIFARDPDGSEIKISKCDWLQVAFGKNPFRFVLIAEPNNTEQMRELVLNLSFGDKYCYITVWQENDN